MNECAPASETTLLEAAKNQIDHCTEMVEEASDRVLTVIADLFGPQPVDPPEAPGKLGTCTSQEGKVNEIEASICKLQSAKDRIQEVTYRLRDLNL